MIWILLEYYNIHQTYICVTHSAVSSNSILVSRTDIISWFEYCSNTINIHQTYKCVTNSAVSSHSILVSRTDIISWYGYCSKTITIIRDAGWSCMDESCHVWMSHVTCERVMSHINESCHIWMCHVSRDVSHIWTHHVLYEPVMSHHKASNRVVKVLDHPGVATVSRIDK